jgi:four helix bundle protein
MGKSPKPFDIRERTFEFARDVLKSYPTTVRSHAPSVEVWRQLIRAATSVGANLEEAHASASKADFRFRVKVSLREARESHYWLRLIGAAGLLGSVQAAPLSAEANELVAILTTIAKRAKQGTAPGF